MNGPVGARGAHETLTSLPWFWTYLLGRVRMVKGVQKAAALRGIPAPDPALVDYTDPDAVRRYLDQTDDENTAFEEEMEQMRAQARRG